MSEFWRTTFDLVNQEPEKQCTNTCSRLKAVGLSFLWLMFLSIGFVITAWGVYTNTRFKMRCILIRDKINAGLSAWLDRVIFFMTWPSFKLAPKLPTGWDLPGSTLHKQMVDYTSKPLNMRSMDGRMVPTYVILNGLIVTIFAATFLIWTAEAECTTFDGTTGKTCRTSTGNTFVFDGVTFTLTSQLVFTSSGGTNVDSVLLFPNELAGVVDCTGANSATNLTAYTITETAWTPDYDLSIPGQTCYGACVTVGAGFGAVVSTGVAVVKCATQSVLAKPPSATAKWTTPFTGGLQYIEWPGFTTEVVSVNGYRAANSTHPELNTTHYIPASAFMVGAPGVIYGTDGLLYPWNANLPVGVAVKAFFSLTSAKAPVQNAFMTQINVTSPITTTTISLNSDTTSCPYTQATMANLPSGAFSSSFSDFNDFQWDPASATLNANSAVTVEAQSAIQALCAAANHASNENEELVAALFTSMMESNGEVVPSKYTVPGASGIPGLSSYVCSSLSADPIVNCAGPLQAYSFNAELAATVAAAGPIGPVQGLCGTSYPVTVQFDFTGSNPPAAPTNVSKPNCTINAVLGWNCSMCETVAQCVGGNAKLWTTPQGIPSSVNINGGGGFVPGWGDNICNGYVEMVSNDTVAIYTTANNCTIAGSSSWRPGLNTIRQNGTVTIALATVVYEFGVVHIPRGYNNRNLTVDPSVIPLPGAPPGHQDCSWYEFGCAWGDGSHKKTIMIVIFVIIGLAVLGAVLYCCLSNGRKNLVVVTGSKSPY